MRLNEEIAKKRPQMKKKKKVHFHQDNAPWRKSIATMEKLHELYFKLLLQPPYSPDLAPVTTDCLQTSKECFRERDLAPMISETEAYFKAKDKSFYKKAIELLEKHWNQCINLGDYTEE